MKTILSQILLLSMFMFLPGCDSKNPSDWEFTVYDAHSNSRHTLASETLGNQLVAINFWAEWCKPCLEEIPELNQFAQQHRDKVLVLGYNFDGKQGDALKNAMKSVNMEFPASLTNPGTIIKLPDISGLPTTVFINAKGELVHILLGPQTLASLTAAIKTPSP